MGICPGKIQRSLENHFLPLLHAVEVVYTLRGEARTKPLMKFSAPGTWSLLISDRSRPLRHGLVSPGAQFLCWPGLGVPLQASPRHIPSLPLSVSLSLSGFHSVSFFLSFKICFLSPFWYPPSFSCLFSFFSSLPSFVLSSLSLPSYALIFLLSPKHIDSSQSWFSLTNEALVQWSNCSRDLKFALLVVS